MTEMIVEITQQQIQPCCHFCASIVDDKRSWTNTDPDASHPYCSNPRSPYYMRKPGGPCGRFMESNVELSPDAKGE